MPSVGRRAGAAGQAGGWGGGRSRERKGWQRGCIPTRSSSTLEGRSVSAVRWSVPDQQLDRPQQVGGCFQSARFGNRTPVIWEQNPRQRPRTGMLHGRRGRNRRCGTKPVLPVGGPQLHHPLPKIRPAQSESVRRRQICPVSIALNASTSPHHRVQYRGRAEKENGRRLPARPSCRGRRHPSHTRNARPARNSLPGAGARRRAPPKLVAAGADPGPRRSAGRCAPASSAGGSQRTTAGRCTPNRTPPPAGWLQASRTDATRSRPGCALRHAGADWAMGR
jgi:hypothetical protein